MLLQAMVRGSLCPALVCAGFLWLPSVGWAQASRGQVEQLKQQLEDLRRQDGETRRQLENIQRRLDALQAQPAPAAPPASDALDRAVQELSRTPPPSVPPAASSLLSQRVGGATVRLIDVSLDVLAAAGGATVGDEALQDLQGGGHDPRKNGFTLQQAELSLMGAVDPYLSGQAHAVFFIDPLEGETKVELEEAFLTTQALPWGLQLKAGLFFTEFGLINPVHPHAWEWIDQPVIHSRFFGADGMRQTGLRVGWLLPTPWYSQLLLGVQNANGETMPSFLANGEVFDERPIGGRPFVKRAVKGPQDLVYLARWENSWTIASQWTTKIGGSAVFGPNATGEHGRTSIYGGDLKMTWRPVTHFRGWPFLLWQAEIIRRDYKASGFTEVGEDGTATVLAPDVLRDWGLYSQLLYGFHYRWAAGVRFEYAKGRGASVEGRQADPFRDTRYRVSPLLVWHPTEFSRLRLQYNYDQAKHLTDKASHAVWLGFEIFYGAHPAHTY